MANIQLNYRVDLNVKKEFEEVCKENDLVTNKTIERLMKEFNEKKKKEKSE